MEPVNKGDVYDDLIIIEETDICYVLGRMLHERSYYDIIMLKDGVENSNQKTRFPFKAQVDHIVIAHDGVPGVVVVPID